MPKVIGVRFKKAGKIYYFAPSEGTLALGDAVIVETARGLEFGEVVIPVRDVEDESVVQPLKSVLRKANHKDKEKVKQNKAKEEEAFKVCEKKIEEHKLPMKLVDVEYTFDVNKLIDKIEGARSIDCGPLERAQIIEKITPLLIGLNLKKSCKDAGIRVTGVDPECILY